MPAKSSIPDVHVFPLKMSGKGRVILQDDDHLLRRFGQLEIIDIPVGQRGNYFVRAVADEILSMIEGEADIALVDLRALSPSYSNRFEQLLNAEKGKGMLIPFGVAVSITSKKGGRLLKVSSHKDGEHSGDAEYSAEEIEGGTIRIE